MFSFSLSWARGGQQGVEGDSRVAFGAGVAEQPRGVVVGQHHTVKIVGELLRVGVVAEVPFSDARAEAIGDDLEPVPLAAHELVAGGTRLVIELGRRRHERTAPGEGFGVFPPEPSLEEGPHSRLATGRPEGRPNDDFDKPLSGKLQQLNLEGLLGSEMGEKAALRKIQFLGQSADREALKAHLARKTGSPFQDGLPGQLSLGHRLIIARSFYLSRVFPPARCRAAPNRYFCLSDATSVSRTGCCP